MPNGKPGDHPWIDIVHHRIDTFSPVADDLVRAISAFQPDISLWSFLYDLYRQGDAIRDSGSPGALTLPEFELFLIEVHKAVSTAPPELRNQTLADQRKRLEALLSA